MVGSIDIGLAFAVLSLMGNLACLVAVFYFEKHLAEEKDRLFQQTWITTDEARKNSGYESDIDTEDADEVQVWILGQFLFFMYTCKNLTKTWRD